MWKSRKSLVELSGNLRLIVSHARYGKANFHGSNTHPHNRIYIVEKTKSPDKSYIANLSASPGQKVILRPGHVYFMPKDQTVEWNFTPGVTFVAFHFGLEIFRGIDLFDGDSEFLERPVSEDFTREIRELMESSDDLGHAVRLHGMIYSLSSMFTDKTMKAVEQARELMREYAPIIHYIEEKCDAQATIAELVDHFGMTRNSLSKGFAQTVGVPLKTFMTRCLLRKVTQQLLTTGLDSKQIAEELGFSSEYYFCRFFKKHTGMTPKAYRSDILH